MVGTAAPGRTGGLLAVHAHPDDETLATGALLATWAAAGRPVTVVTCTRGEQGEVLGAHLAPLRGDGHALARHREGELDAALVSLGVRDHLFLDRAGAAQAGREVRYEDSGMAWLAAGRAGAVEHPPAGAFVAVGVDEAAERLAQVLRDRRPDVVVGYEPGGGYGHPDHVHAHRVMMAAVGLAARPSADGAAPWRVPAVLWSVLDADALRAAYRWCARALAGTPGTTSDGGTGVAGLTAPDPEGELPSAAVEPAAIDLRVPLAPVLPAVLGALRAHASQVQAVRVGPAQWPVLFALSNGVLQPMLATETYRIAHRSSPVRWPSPVRVA
ncbi:MAG TPA: PIG-L family deacetylase [Actinotalea sp.]|nr:PIG-L family deacetylase [Actinotalea sp.]